MGREKGTIEATKAQAIAMRRAGMSNYKEINNHWELKQIKHKTEQRLSNLIQRIKHAKEKYPNRIKDDFKDRYESLRRRRDKNAKWRQIVLELLA